MKDFSYSAPKTVKEAISVVAKVKGDGKIMRGGYICDSRRITAGTGGGRVVSLSACYLLRGGAIDGH
ncbi:MAG TPA: hypothetical protein VKF36_21905 [Syntrophorhabdales bacterium]|nr:hypothetical protein [Syntrophorhabdales bacterium]